MGNDWFSFKFEYFDILQFPIFFSQSSQMERISTVREVSGNPPDLGLPGTLPRTACTCGWKGLSYFLMGFPRSTVVFLEGTDWFSQPSDSVFRSCLYQLIEAIVLTVRLHLPWFPYDAGVTPAGKLYGSTCLYFCKIWWSMLPYFILKASVWGRTDALLPGLPMRRRLCTERK